jgi:hypothetical protein
MPVCVRCNTNIGIFSFRSFSKQTSRCSKCDIEIEQAVIKFIDSFREFAADGVLTRDEWNRLTATAAQDNLDLNEALNYAYPDIVKLIRRGIEIATSDNIITDHEEKYFDFLIQILSVPEPLVQEVRSIVSEYKTAQEARFGKLPVVQPTFEDLPSGETCHMEMDALYINTDTKTYPQRFGKLLATNRRLIFNSPQKSFDIDWKRVVTIVRDGDAIYLDMSIKRGNGLYTVERPLFAEAVITRLVEDSRGQERHREAPTEDEQKGSGKKTTTAETKTHKTANEILNLGPVADRETIRIAYREMAKLYHPDKVASLAPEFRELAEIRMKEINAAYEELTQ